ncbi:MAG: type VI secretion system-associated protein TagF [Myxococcales bacterium]|nr:type VI secretion system-associated protein TagF [Myxococcales bacterium]
MTAPAALSLGLFGKIPTQGDFVRVNGASPLLLAFDQWLQEGLESMRRADVALPAQPAGVLFRAAGLREVLAGVIVPSVDSVGRIFPLTAFALFDGAAIAEHYALVPVACARFLASAAQLLGEAATLTSGELTARLTTLPLPGAHDFSAADELVRSTLNAQLAADLQQRLFPAPPEGRRHYAFRTFLSACEPARGQAAQRPGVTLDCPVGCDLDRVVWLELARRLLRWHDAPPTMLWTDGLAPRLLLSLGPAPSMMLHYYAQPSHGSAKLWPVATDRPEAAEQARRALRATHLEAIDATGLSLNALLTALSGA